MNKEAKKEERSEDPTDVFVNQEAIVVKMIKPKTATSEESKNRQSQRRSLEKQ